MTTLPIEPELFWGMIWTTGLLLALLLAFGALPRDTHHIAPLERFQARLNLEQINPGLFLVGLLVWGLIFGLLFAGLLGLIWDMLWSTLPGDSPALSDWRFTLAKLTATTAVLAAVVAFPVTLIRLGLTRKQTDTAQEALFNDKINAASTELHAIKHTWNEKLEQNIHTPDILRRSTAVARLRTIVEEHPASARSVSNLLSTYVRERSREALALKREKFVGDRRYVTPLDHDFPSNGDLLSAVRALGQLRKIKGVETPSTVVDLREANLQGLDLSFFQTLNSDYSGANFHKANMQAINLASSDLDGAFFREADLEGAFLHNASLKKSNFFSASLQHAQLSDANLSFAIFENTDFRNASLFSADMQNCSIVASDLRDCSFREARLQGALLNGKYANLTSNKMALTTRFNGAQLRGASLRLMNLQFEKQNQVTHPFSQEQIDQLFFDASVALPDFFKRPEHLPTIVLTDEDFETQWRAWQKSIGFDPEDPSTWDSPSA